MNNVDTPSENSRPAEDLRVMQVFSSRVRSGVEGHVLNVARGLRRRGVEVILTPLTESVFSDQARAAGFRVRSPNKRFRGDPRTPLRLARIAAQERIDVVHTHGESASFYGRLGAKLAGVRSIVTTIHSFSPVVLRDWCQWRVLRWLIVKQDQWLARWVKRLILITPELLEPLRQQGFAEEKLTVIGNDLDIEQYTVDEDDVRALRDRIGVPPDAPILGFAGRVVPVKDPLAFVDVAERLYRHEQSPHFLVVGDGPLLEPMKEKIAARGLSSRMHLVGWQEDFLRYLAAMDVLLVTSRYDADPVVTYEAMALQKPILSTRVGILPQLIEQRGTGFLAEDLEGLVEGGTWLLDRRHQWPEIGALARRRIAEHFEKQDSIGRLLDVYYSSLNGAPDR